jgi:UDPglucose 6-dehydrogenase
VKNNLENKSNYFTNYISRYFEGAFNMIFEKKISVVGAGFVGLVTAAVLADKGFETVAVDIDEAKIASINRAEPYFYEPHLSNLLRRVVKQKGSLKATTNTITAVKNTDITFICVETPMNEDGSCNLTAIRTATESIAKAISKKDEYHLLVVKSTVEPMTSRRVVKPILEKFSKKTIGKDFGLCMNPEFLAEGKSVYNTLFPDRIIIGEYDYQSGDTLALLWNALYKTEKDNFTVTWQREFGKQISPPLILRFSLETAECVKYANNSLLATKISFINEFANICEKVPGVDVKDIAEAIGMDYRINPRFLQAGVGFGGSCFPKDVAAIIHFAQEQSYKPQLLESVLSINEAQSKHLVELAEHELNDLQGKRTTVLGLSFKPDTTDLRNAPSLKIIPLLLSKGAKVVVFDPKAMVEAKKNPVIGDKVTYANNIHEALKNSEVCFLITEWDEFKKLEPNDFKNMKQKLILDGRKIYDRDQFQNAGIKLLAIGLGPSFKK